MKIVDMRLPVKKPESQLAAEISEGTTFKGTIGGYKDELFLRIHNRVVSLNNPSATWAPMEGATLTVENYQPVDVEIRIIK